MNNSDNITNTQPSIPLRDRFDKIKRAFSLTEKELAEILLVDSPDTLIAWRRDDSSLLDRVTIIFSVPY